MSKNAPPPPPPLPRLLSDAKAIKKTVLKVKILRLASFNGSKEDFVKANMTRPKINPKKL